MTRLDQNKFLLSVVDVPLCIQNPCGAKIIIGAYKNSETVVIFPDPKLTDFNETDWHRTDREMKVKARSPTQEPSGLRDKFCLPFRSFWHKVLVANVPSYCLIF